MSDTARPLHGWTCFHCGETFRTVESARRHFGDEESSKAACLIKASEGGLLEALRKAESDLADAWCAIHNESTEAAKAYYAQMSRHLEQLREADEAAYARGLDDGKALARDSGEAA